MDNGQKVAGELPEGVTCKSCRWHESCKALFQCPDDSGVCGLRIYSYSPNIETLIANYERAYGKKSNPIDRLILAHEFITEVLASTHELIKEVVVPNYKPHIPERRVQNEKPAN